MSLVRYALRRLLASLPLLIGVTLLSFFLIVYCGPDITYSLLPRGATEADIVRVRQALGYDQPFLVRYLQFLGELARLDFGHAIGSGEAVSGVLARTVPVSLALVMPGFVLGNLAALALAVVAVHQRGRWPERVILTLAAVIMSISFLILIIALQLGLSANAGLGWFPVQGWRVDSFAGYVHHVTVPTLATALITAAYNTRIFRAVLADQYEHDHVRTARAYGAGEQGLLWRAVLRNAAVPIVTRVLFSVPIIVVGGSLVLENQFNVPGVGKVTFDAVASGDQPVLKAVVSGTAVLFVLIQAMADILYRLVDPRIRLP